MSSRKNVKMSVTKKHSFDQEMFTVLARILTLLHFAVEGIKMPSMRIALAQMNSVLGHFSGNRDKITETMTQAKDKNCQVGVFPELAPYVYSP